ncbi:hypothetical protein [Nostoc sp. WHI]|uniref:hypothetical protein n=1 Tax=Nostoc sp. WHI TaxID=2650611 RepID=UPI0018C6E6B2|nr:hypothetical protein [Nostoc sp. WHI]MBG1266167.1 hypothetical protein [Nostoc sp. WHI]
MKISAIVKGGICVLGLVGVGNLFAAPANADQAAARGAVTIVRPSGSSLSVSGEVVAAPGTNFTDVAVVVDGGTAPGTNQETVSGITVTPTSAAITADTSTIEGAIAALIVNYTLVEDVTGLVRAASSGGLE